MKITSIKTFFFITFLTFASLLTGCSSQPTSYDISRGINYVSANQSNIQQVSDSETIALISVIYAINTSGCDTFTLQKVYWGLPQNATKQDVAIAKQYLSSQVNAIHGLPNNASKEQLYNVVLNKLFKTGQCKNMT